MAGASVDGVTYKEDGQQLMNEEEYIRSIPLGFRFRPTDQLLVGYHLARKIKNLQLPPFTRIREVDIYKFPTPNDLIEKYALIKEIECEWYFFTPITRMSANGKRTSRTTPGGRWKATAGDAPVLSRGRIIGHKKTLCFYKGAKPAKKTNWIMHEFRIGNASWVVCKVFERNIGSSTTKSQRTSAGPPPNHANEEQQQNEAVLSATVPAVVANNTNDQQDFLATMIPSEMFVPGNGCQLFQQTDQDSSCPYFDVDGYLQAQQQQNKEVLSTTVLSVVTNNANNQQNFLAPTILSEMVVPGNGYQLLQQTDQDSSCLHFDVDGYLQAQQQRNEEFLSATVPAVVTDNVNEQQDFLAPMTPSQMVVPGNANQPLQQIDQDSSWPLFYVDSYLQDIGFSL